MCCFKSQNVYFKHLKKSDFFPKTKEFDMKTLLQDEILFTLYSMDRHMKNNTIFISKLKNTFKQRLNAIS